MYFVLDFWRRGYDFADANLNGKSGESNSVSPRRLRRKSRTRNDKTAHRGKRTDYDIAARHGKITVHRGIECASLRHRFHMRDLIGQNIVDGEEPYHEEQA